MRIPLICHTHRNVIELVPPILLIPPPVLLPQTEAEHEHEARREEQHAGADPHATGVHGASAAGKMRAPRMGPHCDPDRRQRDGREDARADEEGREVAHTGRRYRREQRAARAADAAEAEDEEAAVLHAVGRVACGDADDVGGEVRGRGQALGVQGGVAHGLQDCGEVCGERAEGGVDTEDHDGLEVVFVIDEGSEETGEVDHAFLVVTAALDGSLADDVILRCG